MPTSTSESTGRKRNACTENMNCGVKAGRDVHGETAADRQDRPKKAEDDDHQEGDDVVGDRLNADGDDAEGLESREFWK